MNRIYLAAIAALLALTACGGGGGAGAGSTGGDGNTGGNDNTGGIDGRGTSVLSQGQITGKGSIIVNGVKYETAGSEIEIDGEIRSEDELEIGDVVLVSGTINDDGTTGTATNVTFDDVVEGLVTAKNADLMQLTVLGQTVQVVDGETLFDDTPPLSFETIQEGVTVIEVSGYRLAGGEISATHIEGKPAGGEYEVTGVVSGLSGMTFMIEGLTVDFSEAIVDDNFPGTTVENGQLVEVKGGSVLGPNGELKATKVEYKGNVLAAASGNYVELEGYITRFASNQDFDVSGFPVMTTETTTIEGVGTLNVNLKVEVEGQVNDAGILVADKVEIKTATGIRAVGLVGSIPPDPLMVFGITINADDLWTRFDDGVGGDNRLENMKLADLRVGDYVEVRGQEQPQGQITAYTIKRDDIDERRELRGFVEIGGKNRPDLKVLGVTVATQPGVTKYRDSRNETDATMGEEEFWTAVQEGSRIDVRSTQFDSGSRILTAEEVELEEDPPAN